MRENKNGLKRTSEEKMSGKSAKENALEKKGFRSPKRKKIFPLFVKKSIRGKNYQKKH